MPGLGNPSHNQQPSLVSITLTLTTVKVGPSANKLYMYCFSPLFFRHFILSLSLFFYSYLSFIFDLVFYQETHDIEYANARN